MPTNTIPLAMPDELLKEVRKAAKETGLSQADVMRQSMKAGLPKVREQFRQENGVRPEGYFADCYPQPAERRKLRAALAGVPHGHER